MSGGTISDRCADIISDYIALATALKEREEVSCNEDELPPALPADVKSFYYEAKRLVPNVELNFAQIGFSGKKDAVEEVMRQLKGVQDTGNLIITIKTTGSYENGKKTDRTMDTVFGYIEPKCGSPVQLELIVVPEREKYETYHERSADMCVSGAIHYAFQVEEEREINLMVMPLISGKNPRAELLQVGSISQNGFNAAYAYLLLIEENIVVEFTWSSPSMKPSMIGILSLLMGK